MDLNNRKLTDQNAARSKFINKVRLAKHQYNVTHRTERREWNVLLQTVMVWEGYDIKPIYDWKTCKRERRLMFLKMITTGKSLTRTGVGFGTPKGSKPEIIARKLVVNTNAYEHVRSPWVVNKNS